MRAARRVTLQLPPNLEGSSKESALRGGPALLLLPQAEERLRRLCAVRDLKLGSMAGRGGTSQVRWTERIGTREMYATKVFNTMHPEHCKVLSTELRVLLMVDCPCVVKFYGAWVDDNFVNLVLEAMRSGSLFDMIYARGSSCFSCPPGVLRWRNRNVGGGNGKKQEEQQQRRRDEKAILAIAFQVLWGLEYLHSIGIVHRDVKPSNVLANTCGSVKLADFCTALFVAEETNDVMGTFRYMPPENDSRQESDVWAAGLVVAEVFVRDVPFKACDSHVELAQLLDESDEDAILEHVLPRESQAPESITRLVKECLTLDPRRRPSASQLLRSGTFSAIGIRTPDQARKVVREWLYHRDGGPTDQASEERRQWHQWQRWEREQRESPATVAAVAATLHPDPFKLHGGDEARDAPKSVRDLYLHINDKGGHCGDCGNSSSGDDSSSSSSSSSSSPVAPRDQRRSSTRQRKQQQRCRAAPLSSLLLQRSRELPRLLSPSPLSPSSAKATKDFPPVSPAPSSGGPFFPAGDSPRQESDATEPPTPPRDADRNGHQGRNRIGFGVSNGGGCSHKEGGRPSPLSSYSLSPLLPQPPPQTGALTAGRWFSSSRRRKGK